jgi:hypothetical protein
MTNNNDQGWKEFEAVPQDVMENTHKPDLIEKLSGLARSIEVCEGWRPTCIDEAIAKLRDQRQQGGEPVGAAVASPDDPGFTIASFEASDVPAGTMLFTQQHPVRESGEAVAYLDYNGELKPTRHGIITVKKGDNLYTTPPQANALVAAAYRKAAEIAAGLVSESKGTDFSVEIRMQNQAFKIAAEEILAAIPADAEAALREVCVGKLSISEPKKVSKRRTGQEITEQLDRDAICKLPAGEYLIVAVNSVLGEGGK